MTNQLIRNNYFRLVNTAVAAAKEAELIDHPALQGKMTEIVVQKLLKPLIPKYVGIGTGKLTDSMGNLSSEQDIVLYVHDILPPLLFDEKVGLFPVESALIAIEVKNQSTAKNVRETVEKAKRSIVELKYTSGEYAESHQVEKYSMKMVLNLYFAFGTDLSGNGKSELDRYREYDPEADTNPAIKSICVIGQGYWWFNQHERRWMKNITLSKNEEVIDFVAGVVNTIPSLVLQKGKPRIGLYIVSPNGTEPA